MTLTQSPHPSCILPKSLLNSLALSICSGQALLALNSYLPWVSQVLERLASRRDPRLFPPRIFMLQSCRELGRMAQNVQWRRGKLIISHRAENL